MFRNRNNSQKPDDELINRFQRTFSDVVPSGGNSDPNSATFGAHGPITPARISMGSGELKPTDSNASQTSQNVRFTPSFMDPLPFMPFPNQSGYYTPNSGGFSSILHSQAGDLHTPNMDMNMIPPLSLSQMAAPPVNPDGTTMGLDFNHNYLAQFQNPQPFAQQQSFAPSAFVHESYDALDDGFDDASVQDLDMDMQGNITSQAPMPKTENPEPVAQDADGENFRYKTTLRAPTAMIKHPKEIPVSYLNKGQAYTLSVDDLTPPPGGTQSVRYRTFVRVSFQEDEQRAKPAACWQLWKEGRGTNESHQRGGKLQAVEYVDPTQGGNEDQKHRQINLETASFDGFCVTWTPTSSAGKADCSIPVRFNFLSTDFSHSKGVKGIPVRLCAKTEMITSDGVSNAEVCYCQVKLFRDHGAERKLSNDVAHVRKTIDKLRQQISQAEMGGGHFGKRKRGNGSIAFKGGNHRPAKISKPKRTWSMDSQDGTERLSLEDDLHAKLAVMQDMFTSTRPVSVLSLRGDEQDDPDLYPVYLTDSPEIKKEGRQWPCPSIDTTPAMTSFSPAPSSMSVNSPLHSASISLSTLGFDSSNRGSNGSGSNSRTSEVPSDKPKHPVKVQRLPSENPKLSTGYIEAVDIDPTYRPPLERPPKPIACFYIRFPRSDFQQDDYYRAVYLTERTAQDLMNKISMKQDIRPENIVRLLHIKQNGLKIMVDDDVVRELPDGQDMIAEIKEISLSDNRDAGDGGPTPIVEIKLTY